MKDIFESLFLIQKIHDDKKNLIKELAGDRKVEAQIQGETGGSAPPSEGPGIENDIAIPQPAVEDKVAENSEEQAIVSGTTGKDETPHAAASPSQEGLDPVPAQKVPSQASLPDVSPKDVSPPSDPPPSDSPEADAPQVGSLKEESRPGKVPAEVSPEGQKPVEKPVEAAPDAKATTIQSDDGLDDEEMAQDKALSEMISTRPPLKGITPAKVVPIQQDPIEIKQPDAVKPENLSLSQGKEHIIVIAPEQYFRLADGRILKSIDELKECLPGMEEWVFRHHVNEGRNDFAEWIKGVFNDIALFFRLENIRERQPMVRVLRGEAPAEVALPGNAQIDKTSGDTKATAGAVSSPRPIVHMLSKLPPDKYFRLSDGRIIKDLAELSLLLMDMADEVYWHHAGVSRNDFANWIADAIGVPSLADRVRGCRDRRSTKECIDMYLAGNLDQEIPSKSPAPPKAGAAGMPGIDGIKPEVRAQVTVPHRAFFIKLRDITPSQYFRVCDGRVIKSMPELIRFIEESDDMTYYTHNNSTRNDFASWIRDVFLCQLYDRINGVKDKKEFLRILEEEIRGN